MLLNASVGRRANGGCETGAQEMTDAIEVDGAEAVADERATEAPKRRRDRELIVYLITALLYGTLPALVAATAIAGMIAGLWFFVPFQRRDAREPEVPVRRT